MRQNRDVMRQHSNKAHNKKRVAEEKLFPSRQLQSWVDNDNHRARYWVVNQGQQDEQERQTQ